MARLFERSCALIVMLICLSTINAREAPAAGERCIISSRRQQHVVRPSSKTQMKCMRASDRSTHCPSKTHISNPTALTQRRPFPQAPGSWPVRYRGHLCAPTRPYQQLQWGLGLQPGRDPDPQLRLLVGNNGRYLQLQRCADLQCSTHALLINAFVSHATYPHLSTPPPTTLVHLQPTNTPHTPTQATGTLIATTGRCPSASHPQASARCWATWPDSLPPSPAPR